MQTLSIDNILVIFVPLFVMSTGFIFTFSLVTVVTVEKRG